MAENRRAGRERQVLGATLINASRLESTNIRILRRVFCTPECIIVDAEALSRPPGHLTTCQETQTYAFVQNLSFTYSTTKNSLYRRVLFSKERHYSALVYLPPDMEPNRIR